MFCDFTGSLNKFFAVRNAFHVKHDDARVFIFGNFGKHIRLVDIRLIAEADDLRKTETLFARPIDDRRAERARVRDKSDATLSGHGRLKKSCIEREMRIERADAIW